MLNVYFLPKQVCNNLQFVYSEFVDKNTSDGKVEVHIYIIT